MTPLLLMTPSETRNADGPVPVTPSASVEVRDGAWWLVRGIGDASLLLSPDGSHDANGPVTPTITGDVSVVTGEHGQAWQIGETGHLSLPGSSLNGPSGALLVRGQLHFTATGRTITGGSWPRLQRYQGGGALTFYDGATFHHAGEPLPSNTPLGLAATWNDTDATLFRDAAVIGRLLRSRQDSSGEVRLGGLSEISQKAPGVYDGVLIFDAAPSDAEVIRLLTMPRAWTWGPDGTIAAPLTAVPATLLLRTRSGGIVTTHHVELKDGVGAAGGASVTHDGTTLTIGTTDEVEVTGVLAFEGPLSDTEIARYTDMPSWLGWRVFGELPASNVVRPSSPPYIAQTRIWRCDRDGRKIEELPLDMPVQGTIVCNEDMRPARKLSLEVNDPDRLEPFRDWIMPEITLTDAAGISRTQDFGLYMVTPPRTTLGATRYSGTIEGMGVTWRLLRATVANGRTIAAGTDHGAAARSIVLESGISPSQVNIPDTGTTLASAMRVDPGDRIMDVATALLNAANWYAPYMINAGQIVTAPTQELATAGATIRYSADRDDVQIIPDLDEDPNWDRLRNKVTVRNIAPSRDPIYWTETITNPSHPLYHDPGDDDTFPVWLSETVNDPQIENEAAARTRARRLLSEGASYYRPLTVRTVLDMDADMHDVIELDLQRHGKTYDGLWFRRAWQVQLRGITAVTESQLWRIENWE